MGRASRAKQERLERLRKFYYQGRQVGWEIPNGTGWHAIPNPPPEALQSWELKLPWTEIGDGVFVSKERIFE